MKYLSKVFAASCNAQLVKNGAPLTFHQSVRFNHSKYHQHITHSRIQDRPPRIPIVEPEFLKWGEPVSPSINLGDMTKARQFKFDVASLNARGFLRFQKAYTPPDNATEKVLQLCRSCMNTTNDDKSLMGTKLSDSRIKYDVLTKAFEEFQHGIPNSMLHMMNTVGDIVAFYCTPVSTQTPYEELARHSDLPPNLHVQKEPIRFHPDTDNMFDGQTAFTKSSTIVTGLRAKKKYRGYEAKMTWP